MAERVPFDTWARFYDTTLPEDRPARPFFLEFCRTHEGPVLELGCGTGDISLGLLAKGIDAYGIDISSEMLDTLHRNASERGLEAKVTQADPVTCREPNRRVPRVLAIRERQTLNSGDVNQGVKRTGNDRGSQSLRPHFYLRRTDAR